jgi:opacity protein-like surface antigen
MMTHVKGYPTAAKARRRLGRRRVAAACGAALISFPGLAAAQPTSAPAPQDKAEVGDATVGPPDTRRSFLQYGLAFTIEDVVAPGPICSTSPCILGSGGGIAVRVGFRGSERLYVGGIYELSKQEPNKLYLLGTLQQIRAEARYYFPTGHRVTPFARVGAGLAGYGNEWNVDTWGPSVEAGAGLEVQLSGGSLVAVSILYRPMYLHAFVDSSTEAHGAGVAQFFGVEVAVEAQDAL